MANIGDAVRVRFDLSKIGGMDAFQRKLRTVNRSRNTRLDMLLASLLGRGTLILLLGAGSHLPSSSFRQVRSSVGYMMSHGRLSPFQWRMDRIFMEKEL